MSPTMRRGIRYGSKGPRQAKFKILRSGSGLLQIRCGRGQLTVGGDPLCIQHIERAAFVVSGEAEVAGQTGAFGEARFLVFKAGTEIVLRARGGAHLTVVGGEPFPEPHHIF
jgi:redox-sensitive bicupin YhaK (pirin superfamily)